MFSAPCDFVSTAPYSYKFGPSSGTALLTMTVADYSRQALLRQCCCIEVRESSSGKNAFFPTMYLLHLHLGFRVASGFILFSRLTHLQMPYAVSVRQVSGLPPASFRSRLAADTLALGYVLGATPCTRDFHPLERAHAERTQSKGRRQMTVCGLFYFNLRSDQRMRSEAIKVAIRPPAITGIVRRMSSMGVMPEMPDTAITTPAIGLMARESPAANCTGTTRAMVL